jgi:type I restriction enzyme S subunit
MGAIAASSYDGVTSPAYDILRHQVPLNVWFYDALFRSGIYLTELKSKSRGIMDMRLRLYFEEFGVVKVPFPPKHEQDEIVLALRQRKERVDGLISHCREHIARLREYRSSLISAAVTGQLNIDDFKARQLEVA